MLKYKCKCSLSCCTTGVELRLLYPPKGKTPQKRVKRPSILGTTRYVRAATHFTIPCHHDTY
jgi:hypothetical protein